MTPSLSPDPTQVLAFAAFGGFFILAGLIMVMLGRRNHRLALASAGWPQVSGTVTAAKVKIIKQKSNDNTDYSYYPTIAYQYDVGGKTLKGKRLSFGLGTMPSYDDAEALLAPYPVGGAVQIFYDPAKPARSTLSTDMNGTKTMGWVGGLLIACGLGFVGYSFFLVLSA